MIDPEYEQHYLRRIADLTRQYEKQLADLMIENAHLHQGFEMATRENTRLHAQLNGGVAVDETIEQRR